MGTVVIDNLDDVDRLERLVRGEQGVLVRVIPGVRPDTHAAVATGQEDSKFGLAPADARRAIERLRGSDRLRLDGLHVHIGSQILDAAPFGRAVAALAAFGEFAVYDLGGGLGARYTYADRPPSVAEYLDVLVGAAREHLPPRARLVIEPGRSLVARAGVTLYRVVTVKRGARTFVAVDGGMGDNLEVSLYGQRFEADRGRPRGRRRAGRPRRAPLRVGRRAVGRRPAARAAGGRRGRRAGHRRLLLHDAQRLQRRRRPPVVFVRDGDARVVVRRERYDDLLRLDV